MEGKWSPLDSPEDARALLSAVEQLERAEQGLRWAEQDVARDERSAEGRAAKHRARALEVASIRQKLDRSMEGPFTRRPIWSTDEPTRDSLMTSS